MEYIVENNNIVINRPCDFDIEHIIECGQCFRFYKRNDRDYLIIAFNRILRVVQDENKVILYNTKEEDYTEIWVNYFDLKRDYQKIKQKLSAIDIHLNDAVTDKNGIRILKQDIWETLISFIISQNKQIPHIKKLIENISKEYGTYIGDFDNQEYYAFPTIIQLSKATEEDLRNLKVGFRAPYIIDACNKIKSGEVDLEKLREMDIDIAKNELMKIKGVGNKVADCVLLFGASRHEVFPTDVWVKRVMEYYYFKEETKINKIHSYAKEQFGELAGFAQQYLFYYARDKKIGKDV